MPTLTIRLPVRPVATVILATVLIGACGPAAASPVGSADPGSGPPPTASPAPTSSPGPTVGAIDHKTGATDVVLRLEEGGGFAPMELSASQAPRFTLYGNGVVVFQPLVNIYPEPDASGVVRAIPWRTAKLDEGQIQDLLDFALGAGGLGAARDSYVAGGIADAGNTIFTIHAGGIDKTVVVNALSEETRPGPDSAARAAFLRIAERLRDFDRGGTIDSDVYVSDTYRAVLLARDPAAELKPVAWPWPALHLSDFKEGANDGTDGPKFPHRSLDAGEVAALGLTDIAGGLQGLVLEAPDGTLRTLILRPLLADERE
ncbi:MAG: hypothetical protein QOF49_1187 [Chloroflexota bacterium]|jgi:hypothetical protein|nr:hypothetical protein [Chloroflexota bacterium]